MSLEVTHDGEAPGEIRERCCICRAHTNFWHASDVALCLNCKETVTLEQLPTKAEWCAKEAACRKLAGQGYTMLQSIGDQGICGIYMFSFTTGLVVGLNGRGYGRRYCYEHHRDACMAILDWDGTGHPGGPWIKLKGTYLGEPVDMLNPEFVT